MGGSIHYWRRKWQPTPVFLPGEFHRQRSLVGYSSWVTKSWTERATNTRTHTSIHKKYVPHAP